MKRGLEYFPLDVHLDDRYKLIEAEYGISGFAILLKLFQKIYGGFGYYGKWNKEVALLFGRETCLGGNVVSEVVVAAIRREIFDKGLYDKYHILTSSEIQKRYFDAVGRRKEVLVNKDYLLINASQIYLNVSILKGDVDILDKNVDILKQSKVKKSKVEKSKEKKVANAPFDVFNKTANPDLIDAWNAFVEMRKGQKAHNTDLVLEKLWDKLSSLGGSDEVLIEILNNSIMNSWKGLYPLNGQITKAKEEKKGYIKGSKSYSIEDMFDIYE